MTRRKLTVLTGAGVSAESGISTFRDSDGLWENHSVEDVASIEGWYRNPSLVLDFYNARRAQLADVRPNDAHRRIAELEKDWDVTVVTQNVDNLHEQAGSTRVLHLHGELMKLRSEENPELIYDINEGWEQSVDERGEDGALLRPHIVFFGEDVPLFDIASRIVEHADILIVVGTSLAVCPAAALVLFTRDENVPIYFVDPVVPDTSLIQNPLTHINERGAVGLPMLVKKLREEFA